jgi:hypothetical protein
VLSLAAMLALGCASSAPAPSEPLSMTTGHGSRQLSLARDGQIIGPTLQLSPTETGYRGTSNSELVDLRSDGQRIVGTIHDKIVDLHITTSADGLLVRGMFAGRLGRLDASNVLIKSSLGSCTYELARARGPRFEGQRACGRGMPMPHPAAVELPVGFERLSSDRQAMLLAILLGQ